MSSVIKIENLFKSYYLGPVKLPVLKNISMEIFPGEMVSLMGTSGCGKSTLMNILGLLDKPDEGQYMFEDESVLAADDNRLSIIRGRKIGFVFQQFYLLPKLDIVNNVALPLTYQKVSTRDRRNRAIEYLEKVGMGEHLHHKPKELSGGQQQRVAIARALVGNPSLILADEPTGALDSRVGQDILDTFIRLNEEEKITVVIITHDANVARQCKRQIRMKDGKILPAENYKNEP